MDTLKNLEEKHYRLQKSLKKIDLVMHYVYGFSMCTFVWAAANFFSGSGNTKLIGDVSINKFVLIMGLIEIFLELLLSYIYKNKRIDFVSLMTQDCNDKITDVR